MDNKELQEAINSLLDLADVKNTAVAFDFLHCLLAEQVRRATGGRIDYLSFAYDLSKTNYG
jgi:hypothetical protein